MIDEKSLIILKYFSEECNLVYKVIEIADILEKFKKINFDTQSIKQIIKYLERNGYINTKYFDDEVVCVSVLPFGRQYLEMEGQNEKKKIEIKNLIVKLFIALIFSAFIASFLGTLIYNLIF